jgi:APA family basic amino acid/polyamine antiporter
LVSKVTNPSKEVLSSKRGHLLRVLGVGFGIAVIIGNTIGAGILRSPGSIAAQLPNLWWYLGVWLIAGGYALLGALSLAELGAMLPRSGGQYNFARYALGEYAGFIVGWTDWISTAGSCGAMALVAGGFTAALFPVLGGPGEIVVAIALTIFFALLQWRGVVLGSTAQNITSLIKTVAFLILIAAAFMRGTGGELAVTNHAIGPTGLVFLTALIIALQGVIYTYDGWTGVIYFSEEVTNPGRDIPRAMIGGVLFVIAIYLLVNIGLLYVLRIPEFSGKDFAMGVVANTVFGHYGDTVFRSLTIISMLSAINACHLMATRVLFAMSRDGLFVERAAIVNPGGTPAFALLLSAAVAVLFILFGQTFENVITVLAFFFVAAYALSFLSVFVLRAKEPDKERPYRVWGYPYTTGIALVGSILFLVGAIKGNTRNSLYAVLLLALSYPVYRLAKKLT